MTITSTDGKNNETRSKDDPFLKVDNDENKKIHYDEIIPHNDIFEDYYRRQGIVPNDEWSILLTAYSTHLPTTFRLTGHRKDELAWMRHHIQEHFVPILGQTMTLCPIPWYEPLGMAWHLDKSRKEVRTEPAYAAFHRWLVGATQNGDISRQEAVSMIPPLLLDIKAGHRVLDMCAAPGSKTAQLIESMHRDATSSSITDHFSKAPLVVVDGMVIANDSDKQRAYMLYHQVKRILSPSLLVTNNDGSLFPFLLCHTNNDDDNGDDGANKMEKTQVNRVFFDRILADVPCSGDGTLRKNSILWKSWNHNHAFGLHPLQIRLLDKAIKLLAVGGRLLYSTCSMNPIENEAVVALVLSKYPQCLELLDVSHELPGLIRRPGLQTWKVIVKDGIEYDSYEQVPIELKKRYPPSVFPRKEEYYPLKLERCLRIYPHLQNTGGFFIAVIHKKAELNFGMNLEKLDEEKREKPTISPTTTATATTTISTATTTTTTPATITATPATTTATLATTTATPATTTTTPATTTATTISMAKRAYKGKKHINQFTALSSEGQFRLLNVSSDPILETIFEWFGIDKRAMHQSGYGFLVRSEKRPFKSIIIVSPKLHDLFRSTFPVENSHDGTTCKVNNNNDFYYNGSLKIINVGVRAFELYDLAPLLHDSFPCHYRLLTESIPVLRPWITKRIFTVNTSDMKRLLESLDSVKLESIRDGDIPYGGAIIECQATGKLPFPEQGMISIPVWIGPRGTKAFVPKENRSALLDCHLSMSQ